MEDETVQVKHKPKKRKFLRKMQAKFLLVFCVIIIFIVILIVKLFSLAITDKYEKHALELRSYVSSEIKSKRGDITDRNGNIIATCELNYTLVFDPSVTTFMTDYIDPTIEALAQVYGLKRNDLREITDRNKNLDNKDKERYIVLKKGLSYEEKAAFNEYVKNLDKDTRNLVKGVWFEDNYKRVYPYGSLASHVVGFAVNGNEGNYGVEQYYNELLNGKNGRTYGYYDTELNIVETVNPPEDGYSVVTTIDINVQRILQNAVEGFLNEYGANNAAAIVMDANSGEILGMQSNYSYNLNSPRDLSSFYSEEALDAMEDKEKLDALYKVWRNFCLSDEYEPGSIYKPFTVSAALEEKIVSTKDRFLCDGFETFSGNNKIKCHKVRGHGDISLAQSIILSCNDALMQIAAKEGKTIFHSYQEDYGIGSITGIDLPGEAKGHIFSEAQLNETELATSSFGQGFTTTMIQMASSFCALVNGGTYYQPHVVRKIVNSQGATVQKIDPLVVNKITSEATSEYLREALYLTVTEGTGKKAQVDGYMIGGKTGTSQKLPRDAEKYLVSFLGFIEDGNRCYIIYVIVDECANEEMASRSDTAVTLFLDIADRCLPYLEVYPEGEIDYHVEIITEDELAVDETLLNDPENTDVSNILGEAGQ